MLVLMGWMSGWPCRLIIQIQTYHIENMIMETARRNVSSLKGWCQQLHLELEENIGYSRTCTYA
jgi:hypothetical protein